MSRMKRARLEAEGRCAKDEDRARHLRGLHAQLIDEGRMDEAGARAAQARMFEARAGKLGRVTRPRALARVLA